MKEFGILVPVVTPCTSSGKLDLPGLRAVCRDMLGAGCDSIFVAGSSGRGPWFSRQERLTLCRGVAEELGGGRPLAAGCMASGLSDMVENARAMADAGATIAVVTAPGYFNYSHAEVETIFARFADASPLPVMIYDIPGFARMTLSRDMILRLARHGNIIGFKDSTGNFERFQELVLALADQPNIYLLQGKERFLADSLLLGASGFVVSMVQIHPAPFVMLRQAVRSGDIAGAHRLQAEIDRLMDLIEGSFALRPETSTFFHLLSQALRQRGICENLTLEHEGECPAWLVERAAQAVQLCYQMCALPA
jgi:4-hydroxy-tetrahydrodipicolinate synthase